MNIWELKNTKIFGENSRSLTKMMIDELLLSSNMIILAWRFTNYVVKSWLRDILYTILLLSRDSHLILYLG